MIVIRLAATAAQGYSRPIHFRTNIAVVDTRVVLVIARAWVCAPSSRPIIERRERKARVPAAVKADAVVTPNERVSAILTNKGKGHTWEARRPPDDDPLVKKHRMEPRRTEEDGELIKDKESGFQALDFTYTLAPSAVNCARVTHIEQQLQLWAGLTTQFLQIGCLVASA